MSGDEAGVLQAGLRSMTGYGAASLDTEALCATVSVRTLNHRFLELHVQVSRALRSLEPELRRLVQGRVRRGRVELSVQAQPRDESSELVATSPGLVAGVVKALREIQAHHGLEGGVGVSDVARFPGTLQVLEVPRAEPVPWRGAVLELVERALGQAEAMRASEGEHLAEVVSECLDRIGVVAGRLGELQRAGQEGRREALLARLEPFREEAGLDPTRLHQEALRFVERSDIAEELARLDSHVRQARELLAAGAGCGKRLDFLAQELMREANTVGSKATAADVVGAVVELKGEIERFREQVQNIE